MTKKKKIVRISAETDQWCPQEASGLWPELEMLNQTTLLSEYSGGLFFEMCGERERTSEGIGRLRRCAFVVELRENSSSVMEKDMCSIHWK
jgi:hypothetical protein